MGRKSRTTAGLLRRHARRLLTLGIGLVFAGYGSTYLIVESAQSGADQRLTQGPPLAYRTGGETQDPTGRVIFVHGSPGDASSWAPFIEGQARHLEGLELIAIDRLGYGESDPTETLTLDAHAASLDPLITPGTILVGHSYGGPIVLRAAVNHADTLGGIVVLAGACDPGVVDAQNLRRLVDSAGRLVPRTWSIANAELLALTDENAAMRDMLESITCPVVVVHGEWDPVCPHDSTIDYLRASLVSADSVQFVSLDRAGHNLQYSHPNAIAGAIRSLAHQRPAR